MAEPSRSSSDVPLSLGAGLRHEANSAFRQACVTRSVTSAVMLLVAGDEAHKILNG